MPAPMAPRLLPAKSMPSRPIRMCGQRPRSSLITTRTTAFSIMCRRRFLRVGRLTSLSTACRSVAGSGSPALLFPRGRASGGYRVCSEPFDHTSVLQFLEKVTGVRESNISDWRRSAFGDLTAAFRFREAAQKAPLMPDTVGALSLAQYSSLNLPKPTLPGADQQHPRQEKGRRNRIAKGAYDNDR